MYKTSFIYLCQSFGVYANRCIRSSRAVAQKTLVGGECFGFAVFAGEGAASFNGTAHIFDGGVYGRDGVTLGNGAEIIHGDAVSSNATCDPFNGPGMSIKNNPVIPMPDLSGLIKSQGIIVNSQAEFDDAVNGKSVDGPIYVNGNLTITVVLRGVELYMLMEPLPLKTITFLDFARLNMFLC